MATKQETKETATARMDAMLRQENLAKKKEGNRFLLLAIYSMAFFFFFDILYIQDVWLALIAMAAQLFDGVFDTTTWVAWWKGTMTVIKVGGFGVSLIFARFLARQRA